MRLYLSSYKIPDITAFKALAGQDLSELKCGILAHAKDYYSVHVRSIKLEDKKAELEANLGIKKFQTIDLSSYSSPGSLEKDLKKMDMLYVTGGNTFCLNEAIQKGSFKTVIQGAIKTGLLYVGESAGAVIVGPSLETVEKADDARFAMNEPEFRGLEIIDEIIIPHDGSEYFSEYSEFARDYFKDRSDVVFIRDDQAYVIDGDSRKVVKGEDSRSA